MKEHFKASTTSISDAIRIFVWKLALLFYNAWLLLRILLRDNGDGGEARRDRAADSLVPALLGDRLRIGRLLTP